MLAPWAVTWTPAFASPRWRTAERSYPAERPAARASVPPVSRARPPERAPGPAAGRGRPPGTPDAGAPARPAAPPSRRGDPFLGRREPRDAAVQAQRRAAQPAQF